MSCDKLLIKRGQHTYTRYAVARRDFLVFEADKRTYRLLAFALRRRIFWTAAEMLPHVGMAHSGWRKIFLAISTVF